MARSPNYTLCALVITSYYSYIDSDLHISDTTFLGFRVEHPQALIDKIQYGNDAGGVMRGKGSLPVASYRLAATIPPTSASRAPSVSNPAVDKDEVRQ